MHVNCRNAVAVAAALSLALAGALLPAANAAPADNQTKASACGRELENANKTISKWADNMENMVNESELPTTIRSSIHDEANKILDMIEDFGEQIKVRTPDELAKNLVTIRRRSNRMALDIYLNTFDMRWPQNSLQLGVIVERVQQACLERAAIQALESPSDPLGPLNTVQ